MTLGRRVLATALAAALLVALLLLSSLGIVREPPAKRPTIIEDVRLYVPPQPPRAPDPLKPNERGGSPGMLQVRIPPREVELGLMKLDTSAASAVRIPSGYGLGAVLGAGIGTGIGNDNGNGERGLPAVFAANQLDSIPMVMSAPVVSFVDRMRRLNILKFRVVFQIIVDQEGHAHPVRIVEAPSFDFEKQLMDYASRTVFTPPLHQGKPVAAEYLWPVVFDLTAAATGR
jgi:TonB-like protein